MVLAGTVDIEWPRFETEIGQ